ncbi:MAG: DNA translocase FtsK 4TM domain-containing protein [Zhenhengia sp.]|uniref:DNA translocase FtsK n=1 Tax=Zhenhengia yiwuensis TaxID=2763666 RepID=A0A926EIA3_9FIRM|nr:DNA translocase FtsK [Zhenhengia yiwuensis]MBC8580894.1 DNA translocase FtsK [Zhenhengia yiwuensis]
MKKNTTKNKSTKNKKTQTRSKKTSKMGVDLISEMIGISMIGISLLILVSLFTDQAGLVGTGIKTLFVGCFGMAGYLLPFAIIIIGYYYLKNAINELYRFLAYSIPFLLILMSFGHLLIFGKDEFFTLWRLDFFKEPSFLNGGLIGALVGELLLTLLGLYGSYIILVVLAGIWILAVTKFPIFAWLSDIGIRFLEHLKEAFAQFNSQRKEKVHRPKKLEVESINQEKLIARELLEEVAVTSEQVETFYEHPPIVLDEQVPVEVEAAQGAQETHTKNQPVAAEMNVFEAEEELDVAIHQDDTYIFPSIQLLKKGEGSSQKTSSRASLSNAKKLEDTLLSFGVEAKVTQINKGPTVTRYELQPKQGVKVSKIVNLADDIALNLAASGIRIEAPIPGKAAVGIEVPNDTSEMVYLRDVIESDQFAAFPSKLAFALGKDIAGKPIVADIGKMPHILIAGATGSGKSVCINTLITSILYKASPKEVKLIMIDPKVVELNVYNGIPHLMIPVVTDPKKAAGALCWAVNEMTKRYQLFADNNVRDMKGYNNKVTDENLKMPSIIIIIDELADLMMTAAKEVEDAICRLAQMARAAGIHLVIATQRPSVDVITGVIKANIPSRLAFAVSSGIDSRTILDSNGAEKLLGKGDMLFCPIGESKPLRIQGAFVSDQEVEAIVEAVKMSGEVQYEETVMESIHAPAIAIEGDGEDELLTQAIQLASGKEKLSISMLQRYFRIGFNRASRLMEMLEARGIVGPDEGSKPRKVLQQNQLSKGEEL